MHDTSAAAQVPEELDIFHDRDFGETAKLIEDIAAAKQSVIAAAHAQQKTSVVGEGIGQPIDQCGTWQTNAEESAGNAGVFQEAPNVIETTVWHLGIDVQEPQDFAMRNARSGIELLGAAALRRQHSITIPRRQLSCLICAAAIDHDYFCAGRAFAQLLQKRADQRRFVKHRNNDRDLRGRGNRFSLRLSSC